MADFGRTYTITLTKDTVNKQFVSRVSQKGLKHGILVETPMEEPDCVSAHVEELKEILEHKMAAYYNKQDKQL
jgi:hypothetical protein